MSRFGLLKLSTIPTSPAAGFGLQARTKWTLPDLPYDYKALEPTISGDIMQLHHQKHHATYVTNLNAAEEKLQDGIKQGCANAIISVQPALRFNGGGHINHSIFWQNLSPKGGGSPSGTVSEAIKRDFDSFDNFKKITDRRFGGRSRIGLGLVGLLSYESSFESDHVRQSRSVVPNHGFNSSFGHRRLGARLLSSI